MRPVLNKGLAPPRRALLRLILNKKKRCNYSEKILKTVLTYADK